MLFWTFQVFPCVLPEERIEPCHTAIKLRLVECCSDVCPSIDFCHLHIQSWPKILAPLVNMIKKGCEN